LDNKRFKHKLSMQYAQFTAECRTRAQPGFC